MWPIPVGRIAFLNPNSSDSPRRWTVSPKTSVNRSTAASRSLTTTVSSTMSPSMAPPYGVGGDHTVESGASTAELRGDLTTMPKRWALSVPLDGFTLAEHAELAREAERLGYTDAWSLEVDGVDCFAPLAVVGLATRLRVGTAIANVYTRGPATLALSAAGIAEIAPGRFCLGIGSGSEPVVEAWNGGAFARPATRVRETAQFLRRALAGERVVFRGETFAVDGFRLTKPPVEPVPIHIAALRPGMLRVAGEVGDGAILNWLAADDVPKSVAAVPEKVIDDLIIRGSTDEIRAHVRRYLAAGIDTAFLALSTAEPDPVRKREIVLGAVRALTPSPR